MVNTNRTTIGMLVVLSALLVVFAAITKSVLDMSFPGEPGISATITVSGMEQPDNAAADAAAGE